MKIKLFVILFTLLPSILTAQTGYSSVLWDASMASHGEIVRSWGSDHVLTYHIGPAGNYFTLTRVSDFHSPASSAGPSAVARQTSILPAGMWVYDVRILNDEAFFCGSIGINAVLGQLNLNDFATGTVTISYITASSGVTRYKKLVAYYYTSTVSIVACIGENASSGYNDVASVYSYAGSFSHLQTYNLPSEEDMDDILYTGDAVVMVGRYNDPTTSNQLIIRRCPSTSLPAALNDRIIYPSAAYEVNGTTSSVYMRGFSPRPVIAVSYVHYDQPTQAMTTRVRYIDLQTMAMLRSNEFPRVEKEEVLAMVYSRPAGRLAVMFSEPEPGITGNVTKTVLLQPEIPGPYPGVKLFFPPPVNFNSADILSDPTTGYIDLVEAGGGRWYLQHIPTAGPATAGCPAGDPIPVDVIANLPTVSIPYSTTFVGIMPSPDTWPMPLSPSTISTPCFRIR